MKQREAMFWLFSGGGGHPTHIFNSEFSFYTSDGLEHRAHASEYYPPRWNAPLTELQSTFRKGNVIPIRYLPTNLSFVRSQKYLDLFTPAAVSNPFFVVIAPWIFAVPVLIGLFFSKQRKI